MHKVHGRLRTTVVIPSYRRPEMLAKCMEGLRTQILVPDEIVICLRDEDKSSYRELIENCGGDFPHVRIAISVVPGVIAAMNAGIRVSTGAIVALLDDDAVPRADWLELIHRAFVAPLAPLGVGGRDLQENPDHKRRSSRILRVGTFTWYGRLLGNHHLAEGPPQLVHVLKGCNCAYRGDFLRAVGVDSRLRGKGAQVGWEVALGLRARADGGILVYDPSIRVNHLIAPRHDADTIHRGRYNAEAAYDITWNTFFILRNYGSFSLRVRAIAWELLVGSANTPGIMRLADARLTLEDRLRRLGVTLRAFTSSAGRGSRERAFE